MGYGNRNKQQLDEHVSLMEAQFADRFGSLDDQLTELRQNVEELPALKLSIDQLNEELPAMRHALSELQGLIQQLIYSKGNEGAEGSHSKTRGNKNWETNQRDFLPYNNGNVFPKLPKLEFPKFYGGDSYGWVRKAERYFEFHPMDEMLKVNFASVHFEGQAEHWFGTYTKAKGKVSWTEFVRDLNSRFAQLFKESIIGEFHKLRQLGSVEQYYNEFKTTLRSVLVNEGCKFEEVYFVQSFISGLKDELRLEVEKFEVHNLSRAIYLARKQEATINNSWYQSRTTPKFQSTYNPMTSAKPNLSNTVAKPRNPALTLNPQPLQAQPNNQNKALLPTPNVPQQRLTRAYFDDRRKRGLCYWCEETFSPAHVCKNKQVSMLVVDEVSCLLHSLIFQDYSNISDLGRKIEKGYVKGKSGEKEDIYEKIHCLSSIFFSVFGQLSWILF
ncbi:hypothetical protein RJ640_022764 [Escallonia rubra]|uniref:Ty3 transposon capsid-like protein domain-containing protein n=1 Tax=Escallonia rubra TaxID=112253 RepID=A0AA88R0S4_9ASTE|nr:hypothetical protein RJ640_022764 [Escallonia rubra]